MRFRTFAFIALASALLIGGCTNDPASSGDPIPIRGDFRAIHIEDDRPGGAGVIDTVYVWFLHTSAMPNLTVDVGGTQLNEIDTGLDNRLALYAANVPVAPGGVISFTVDSPWRSATNQVLVPSVQPVVTAPRPDSVYSRSAAYPVSWTSPGTGTVIVEVYSVDAGSEPDSLLYQREYDADTLAVTVPASLLSSRTDSTFVVTVWNAAFSQGEGFRAMIMQTKLGERAALRIKKKS